jgi:hypothetical protein
MQCTIASHCLHSAILCVISNTFLSYFILTMGHKDLSCWESVCTVTHLSNYKVDRPLSITLCCHLCVQKSTASSTHQKLPRFQKESCHSSRQRVEGASGINCFPTQVQELVSGSSITSSIKQLHKTERLLKAHYLTKPIVSSITATDTFD